MACNDRQLTDAQREAAFNQQRTGVVRAIRPFIGTPSIENLIDYLNRELIPALRASREKVNDVWKQVVDNAPSANPLAYYFSTSTTNADPTDGRIRLNQATQNTATVIRVSENNARLQTVQPWLDVMSGGPTTPLGTVTLVDAIDPSRFLRFDLNTMTDQGAYWDLGVTLIEASHDDPFVDGEAVTLGFIAGVSAAGSTVPVGSLSPVATDTFLGNISGSTAAPSAVPLASIDSTSITYDGTNHEFRRAALTGFAEATANSNATTSAEPIVTYSASSNMSAERVTTSSTSVTVSTGVAGQIEFQRAALTGAIAASANANATVFAGIRDNGAAENDRTNLNFVSSTSNTLVVTDDAGNDELEVTVQRAALTGEVTASANSNSTTVTRSTDFSGSPWTGPHTFNDSITFAEEVTFNNVITPSAISSNQDDYSPTGWAGANIVRLSTNSASSRDLNGVASVSPGQLKWLVNLGPGTIRLQHEAGTSSGSNRFLLTSGTTFGILVNGVCGILYDASSSRWRPIYPDLIT